MAFNVYTGWDNRVQKSQFTLKGRAPSVGYMAVHDGDLLRAHLWTANCILHGFATSAPANNIIRQKKATG